MCASYSSHTWATASSSCSRSSNVTRCAPRLVQPQCAVLIRVNAQTRHALDPHLSNHMVNITNMIRSRALVQYFQPFASIKLDRMSSAFGWTVEELERQVVTLIQAGEIQARVDRQNKVRV